jgi:hypothetical protein
MNSETKPSAQTVRGTARQPVGVGVTFRSGRQRARGRVRPRPRGRAAAPWS